MNEIIFSQVEKWSNPPFDEATITEIRTLKEASLLDELEDRFYRNLVFGTGGLRGKIGAGTNRMNNYTVGLATQALSDYLHEKGVFKSGVVISRDSRILSDEFALECACILAANDIPVYLFEQIMPTPLCSFAIRTLQAAAGIMITASHNPPEYNGYKVFWNDGAQIVAPVDSELISRVNELDDISLIRRVDYEAALADAKITLIGKEITDQYRRKLAAARLYQPSKPSDLRVVYTPLHGTGISIIPEILRESGYGDVHIVASQAQADGNFPTVKYPNPEERETLELAVSLANECEADIILATDPDADRVGVGVKHNGAYRLLDGNQAGTLLLHFILSRRKQLHLLPDNSVVIKTIITTRMQQRISEHFGCRIIDVLTGFKWIADTMAKLDESGAAFIFGGEESYGYLPIDFVRDKDAVSASLFFCDMAAWLKEQGKSTIDYLDELYRQFGYYTEEMHYVTLEGSGGMKKIEIIMEQFRKSPPHSIAGHSVVSVKDYKTQKIHFEKTSEKMEGFPLSDVLQFSLDNGSMFTIRPSGTEPKIKFYISAVSDMSGDENVHSRGKQEILAIKKQIDEILHPIID